MKVLDIPQIGNRDLTRLGFAQLLEVDKLSLAPPGLPALIRFLRRDGTVKADRWNLELAVIESGWLSMALELLSLSKVLHECRTMMKPQAHMVFDRKRADFQNGSDLNIRFAYPDPVPKLIQMLLILG